MFSDSTALTAYRDGFRGRTAMATALLLQTMAAGKAANSIIIRPREYDSETPWMRRTEGKRCMKGIDAKRAKRKVRAKMRKQSRSK